MLTLTLSTIIVGLALVAVRTARQLRRQAERIRFYRAIVADYQARVYALQKGVK